MFGMIAATARIAGTQTFASSGSFRVPTKVTSLTIVAAAVGGFGGTGSGNAGGGGGGGGEVCYAPDVPVTPGQVITFSLNATPASTGTTVVTHPTLGALTVQPGITGSAASGTTGGAGGDGGGTGGGTGGTGGTGGAANGNAGNNASAAGSDTTTWSGVTITRYYGGGGGGGASDSNTGSLPSYVGGSGGQNSDGDAGTAGALSIGQDGYGGGGGGAITFAGITGPSTGGAFDTTGSLGNGTPQPGGSTGWVLFKW